MWCGRGLSAGSRVGEAVASAFALFDCGLCWARVGWGMVGWLGLVWGTVVVEYYFVASSYPVRGKPFAFIATPVLRSHIDKKTVRENSPTVLFCAVSWGVRHPTLFFFRSGFLPPHSLPGPSRANLNPPPEPPPPPPTPAPHATAPFIPSLPPLYWQHPASSPRTLPPCTVPPHHRLLP